MAFKVGPILSVVGGLGLILPGATLWVLEYYEHDPTILFAHHVQYTLAIIWGVLSFIGGFLLLWEDKINVKPLGKCLSLIGPIGSFAQFLIVLPYSSSFLTAFRTGLYSFFYLIVSSLMLIGAILALIINRK